MSEAGDSRAALAAVAGEFQISGRFVSAEAYGTGHINDTYCAVFEQPDGAASKSVRVILQRINHKVFKNPVAVMENIQRVTEHLAAKVAGEPDAERRVLTPIPARNGSAWRGDEEGNYWRAYNFIENARSYDTVESPHQAYEAAKAFGRFQRLLSDLPAPRLHDTILDFHHTPKRFEAFEQALAADATGRAELCRNELAFARAHKPITTVLLDAGLPERVTHNDTKFSNVMLDDATCEGICVIDLDTVMPGLALYDFGDMVRTTTSAAAEDEQDLSLVTMQFPMFEALTRGYLASAGGFLTQAEKDHLVFSTKLITFEQGIRFLADYLAGDVYYKVHRAGQNLDRCRTQFKLVESIEQQEQEMQRLVDSIAGKKS